MKSRALRIGAFTEKPEQLQVVRALRRWTRDHFQLDPTAVVMVAELTCTKPGCPPLETLIAFWIDERRHRFKVFKAIGDIQQSDFPPPWLRDFLASEEPRDDECC
jgi:nitrate reductase delta subunit